MSEVCTGPSCLPMDLRSKLEESYRIINSINHPGYVKGSLDLAHCTNGTYKIPVPGSPSGGLIKGVAVPTSRKDAARFDVLFATPEELTKLIGPSFGGGPVTVTVNGKAILLMPFYDKNIKPEDLAFPTKCSVPTAANSKEIYQSNFLHEYHHANPQLRKPEFPAYSAQNAFLGNAGICRGITDNEIFARAIRIPFFSPGFSAEKVLTRFALEVASRSDGAMDLKAQQLLKKGPTLDAFMKVLEEDLYKKLKGGLMGPQGAYMRSLIKQFRDLLENESDPRRNNAIKSGFEEYKTGQKLAAAAK